MHRPFNLFSLYLAALLVSNNIIADAAVPDGIVVYCSGTGLKSASPLKYVVITKGAYSKATTLTSASGKNPRISPDGKFVVFDNGSKLFACRLQENASVASLGTGAHPFWVTKSGATYIFYSSQSGKKSFGTGKSYLRKINTATLAWDGDATEVKYGGKSSFMKGGMGVNGTYACTGYPDCVIAKADPGGTVRKIGGSQRCNPSISPTSNKMMILDDTGHKTLATYAITGSRWAWSPGGHIQNPEWSTDEKWCTWVAGNSTGGQVYVGDMGSKKGYRINGASGTFPHYYKGPSKPGPSAPSLSAHPSKVEFTAEKGKSAPAAKIVTVSISKGSISGLKAAESAPWLTLSISGGKVTNTVSHSGLAAKTYTTTVNLTASGADPASYTVNLTVVEAQVLTSLVITPANPTVRFGSKTQFIAKAKDQNGKDMASQPAIAWSATGEGSISPSGMFTAGSKKGTATITAKGGGKTVTTKATVAPAPPVALRINCGGNAVGQWKADQYAPNGAKFAFGGSPSIAGLSNPAPSEVYATVRHQEPIYAFPSSIVGNGAYTVRLHFNDGKGKVGDRKMDITIEGKKVLTGYDIVAKAGGNNKGVVEQISISVSDGNGMTIEFAEGSGADAFVAGIEIIGGDPSAKTVTVLEPKGGETVKVGGTLHIKWKTIESIVNDVQLEISLDNGRSYLPIRPKGSIDTNMKEWGDFAWIVPASITTEGKTVALAGKTCVIRVIEYSGTPHDVSNPFTIRAEATISNNAGMGGAFVDLPVHVAPMLHGGVRVAVLGEGWHTVRLIGADGAIADRQTGLGRVSYILSSPKVPGVYLLKAQGAWGKFARVIIFER